MSRDEQSVERGGGEAHRACAHRIAPEFVRVAGLPDADAAEREAFQIAVELAERDPLLRQLDPSRLVVLQRSRIPPAGSGYASPFLALHFEWGQPLFPTKEETLYLFLALLMPQEEPASGTTTRIVSVERLVGQRSWGDADEVEKRLREYVASHGSSWDWDGDTGGRVSCFARIVDALAPEHVLTNFRQVPREQWYERSRAANEFGSLEEERAFYRERGVDVKAAECSMVMQPGELLVVNNVRAVHGRTGRRRVEELHQVLLGIRDVHPDEASVVRRWLIEQIAHVR